MTFGIKAAQFGEWVLVFTLFAAVYAGVAAVLGAKLKLERLRASANYGAYLTTAFLSLATAVVFFFLLSNDFSVKYVYLNSNASMPWYYKLTAYWGGLDGSILFWAWLLSLFSALTIHQNRHRHRDLIPWVIVTLMGILIFFLILLLFYKRPFEVFLTKAPVQGKGLNPLLQDPYMATHPPSLYVGYVSASIPFAFGIAALITGQVDETWIQSMRRWMLVCFYFLSQGLILGSLWAYHVLGWGGYWNWDPVENAGLLPWFTATAFLHSITIQERKGMMKVWNLVLVILTFLLTMVGTFLTRSGVVQSVHAFGEDQALAALFLTLIGTVTAISFGLLIHRLPRLRSREHLDSVLSREFAFLCNNWVLLGAAFFVLVATLFPTLSETLRRARITVGPPFYNRWLGPLGLLLLFLTGVGPLIPFGKSSWKKLGRQFFIPMLVCGITILLLALFFPTSRTTSEFLHTHFRLPTGLICIGLCAFVVGSIAQEFYQGTLARRKMTGLGRLSSFLGLVSRNRRRYGGYVVHVGIALMFLGFAGQPYEEEYQLLFSKAGQEQAAGKYRIRYEGYTQFQDSLREQIQEVKISIFKNSQLLDTVRPAKWSYRGHTDEPPRTIVSLRAGLKNDVYLIFDAYDPTLSIASVRVLIKPLVTWIWIGFVFLFLGTVIAFFPESTFQRGLFRSSPSSIALFLFVTVSTMSPVVLSNQVQAEESVHTTTKTNPLPTAPRNDLERNLRRSLVCMCGGCGRQTLADCTCGYAAKERAVLASLLDQGRSREEILAYFTTKYHGESVLVTPSDQGFNRLAWILPTLGMVGALGLLGAFGYRLRKRNLSHKQPDLPPQPKQTSPYEQRPSLYEQKLDEELDDLG